MKMQQAFGIIQLLKASSFLLLLVAGTEAHGCGLFCPPMPCPPPALPMCAPPTICPPPPLPNICPICHPPCPPCPPTFCPPPPVCPPPMPPCPPPPLPPPFPICPLPLPPLPQLPQACPCPAGAGIGMGIGMPQPQYAIGGMLPPPPPPMNDCCGRCGAPCSFLGRMRSHGARIYSVAQNDDAAPDPTCNSEKLRSVIEENISDDPTTSKRAIQKAAEAKLFSKVNVICANSDFSYIAYTNSYCQASIGDITCYAFQPMPEGTFAAPAERSSEKESSKTAERFPDIATDDAR